MKNPVPTFVCWLFLTGPSVRFIPKDVMEFKYLLLVLAVMVIVSILFKDKLQKLADTPISNLFKSRPSPKPSSPKITYSSDGRSGHVHYRSPEGSFDMYYEFGGGEVVAGINVPSTTEWVAKTGIPLERREEVLNAIGQQVVKDQTKNGRGSYKIEGNWLNIYA